MVFHDEHLGNQELLNVSLPTPKYLKATTGFSWLSYFSYKCDWGFKDLV